MKQRVMALIGALSLAACGAEVPLAKGPAQARKVAATEYRGDTACAYGSASCSTCAEDVEGAFDELGGTPAAKFRYAARENQHLPPHGRLMPRFTITDHVQSFARLAGVGNESWFVATRSQPNQPRGRAGFFFVNIQAFANSGGEAARGIAGRTANHSPGIDYFYPMFDTDHPGGMQLLGSTLAIGAECSGYQYFNKKLGDCAGSAFVEFYDVSKPAAVRNLGRLLLDGSQGEINQHQRTNPHGSATGVAVTRLADQRHLLFVLGKDRRTEGWFYVSDPGSISEKSRWRYLGYWNREAVLPDARQWSTTYQNINFINECGSGVIYAVAMGRDRKGEAAHLFKLVHADAQVGPGISAARGLAFERRGEITLQPSPGKYCTVRAGSGMHVTPSHQLALYCSTHKSARGQLKFEEYASDFTKVVKDSKQELAQKQNANSARPRSVETPIQRELNYSE